MTKEINLLFLLKILKSAWWKILIFTVVVAIAVAAITEFVIPKKYASTTEFYVLNTSTTSEYTTTALLSAAEYLAGDYIEIINGDTMIGKILDDLTEKGYTDYTYGQIRNMITAETSGDSSTFEVTITHTDRELAFYIADSIKKNAPEVIKDITRPSYASSLYRKGTQTNPDGTVTDIYTQISEEDLECVKVLRAPGLPKEGAHVSPSLFNNTVIAAVLAAIIAYVFFLVRKILDTTIRTEENAKVLVGETVIGDIPTWENRSKSENTESAKKDDEVKKDSEAKKETADK